MTTRERARDDERRARMTFAKAAAEDAYRAWQGDLYHLWERWNAEHFQGSLKPPHLGIGRTPPRSLGTCSRTTDYGAELQITMHEALVFGSNPLWVVAPNAEGHRRAVIDLFLRLTVQQYVVEHLGADERRYYGCGPRFHAEVNRVGLSLKLPQVIFDRSGVADADQPICKGWPHNVRPEGYYGRDVTKVLLDKLMHPAKERQAPGVAPPTLGIWELVLFFQAAGRHEEVRRIAADQVDRLKRQHADFPVLAKFEAGDEDEDGSPIPYEVTFDPAWLAWNGGTVLHLAQGIHGFRQYTELPILADALEEAGCRDGFILRHLRARTKGHDARCWVLRGLLPAADESPK